MNIIITEQQLKYILEQQKNDNLSSNINNLITFTKEILIQCKANYNIDLQLPENLNAAVGGFIMPLDNYIRTSEIELSDKQVSLILVGVISTLIIDNKPIYDQVLLKVKEDGLIGVFNNVLTKGKLLKKAFINFLLSLNLTSKNTATLLRYSFLIPIIMDLESLVQQSKNISETARFITDKIISTGAVSINSENLFTHINKILLRLKENL
jgi:hypothetical protein